MPTPDLRKREIAMIKIGVKQLGMDDATYREMLMHLTQKRSAADLDDAGRNKVLGWIKAKGWKPVRSVTNPRPDNEWAFVDKAATDRRPLLRKIIMLARQLGYDKASVETLAIRMWGGVQKLEFCDANMLRAIVAELNQQVGRIDARSSGAAVKRRARRGE